MYLASESDKHLVGESLNIIGGFVCDRRQVFKCLRLRDSNRRRNV